MIRIVSLEELKKLPLLKPPSPFLPPGTLEDQHALLDPDADLLAIIVKCNVDNDYNVVVAAREDEVRPYRAIDVAVSFPTIPEAETEAQRLLEQWKKDRALVLKHLN